MKALVLEQYHQLTYKDVPEPQIQPDEVLVQVKACGICGSDVHGIDGSTGRRVPPIIMGHEASGVIVDVGREVRSWQNGDRVTFDCVVHCGQCYFCQRGLINLCDQRRWIGVSLPASRTNGAFAEYVAVPQQVLHRLPDGMPYPRAALMETLSIAFHGVKRVPLALHDSAVVVGAGMIGLLTIQLLKLAGCSQIIAVESQSARLDLARRFGATLGLRSDIDDVSTIVAQCTNGRGADVGFEVVGLTPTIGMAIASVRKGGALSLIGNFAPTVDFPLQDVVLRQLSLFGSANAVDEQDACLELLASGAVNVDDMISAVAPLSEGAAWFDRLYQREPGLMKVILEPG
jgi:L-iditol 2-dehydrogenase